MPAVLATPSSQAALIEPKASIEDLPMSSVSTVKSPSKYPKINFTVRVTRRLRQRFERMARAESNDVANLARRALEEYVSRWEATRKAEGETTQ